jgi:Uma2 family endonuclease
MGLPQRDDRYHTYADYLTWDDERRYELIDGQAYCLYDPKGMAPAPTRRHQQTLGDIYFQIRRALRQGSCQAYLAPFDVRLPKGDETDAQIDTVVQPDLSVICDPGKLDDAGCRGAPDWIIEILSPSTAGHDQIRKLRLYERSGVREYWLVHPTDRILTLYRLEQAQYGCPEISEMKGTMACGILPELVIDWDLVSRE